MWKKTFWKGTEKWRQIDGKWRKLHQENFWSTFIVNFKPYLANLSFLHPLVSENLIF